MLARGDLDPWSLVYAEEFQTTSCTSADDNPAAVGLDQIADEVLGPHSDPIDATAPDATLHPVLDLPTSVRFLRAYGRPVPTQVELDTEQMSTEETEILPCAPASPTLQTLWLAPR